MSVALTNRPDGSNQAIGAADMLSKDDASAGPEDPHGFAHRSPIIGDGAKPVGADDRVEGLVCEVELLSIADAHVDLAAKVRCALTTEFGHLRAELDPRHLDVG